MKYLVILLISFGFSVSAISQEVEAPGKPTEEMILLGNKPAKPIKLEPKDQKKSQSSGGALDKDGIRRVMREGVKNSFKDCYEAALKDTPKLNGKVVLGWIIDESGRVKDSKIVSSTLKNEKAETCILDALKTFQFPGAPQGQTVSVDKYPLVFSSKRGIQESGPK